MSPAERVGAPQAPRSTRAALVVVAALLAMGVVAPRAGSAEGRIEINQTRALAGGVTPSDTPGFPVTIDTAGSYVLTGDLDVPTTTASAIRVLADDVTLDLNGFTLRGQVTCTGSGAAISCTSATSGVAGVRANGYTGTTVRNGHIRGFYYGVWLDDECAIERVVSTSNETHGFFSDRHCRIRYDAAVRNGGNGFDTDRGNVLFGNVAADNGGTGIRMRGTASTLRANAAGENGGPGMGCFRNCVVEHNALYFNGGDGLVSTGDGTIANGNSSVLNGDDQIVLSGSSGFVHNVILHGGKVGGLVTQGVYMPDNVCDGASGSSSCATFP